MVVPSMGPDPVLISRKQVEALYTILDAVSRALTELEVPWIITGGSLLGSVRQNSILFSDDDVDLAIIGEENYLRVSDRLQEKIGSEFTYSQHVWEGGDRVRLKRVGNVFLDIFQIREYRTERELTRSINTKSNGQPQSPDYVERILETIRASAFSQAETSPLFPCWHFTKRKAIELWPKEVYRAHELFPIQSNFKMGPIHGLSGPRTPVLLLKRAFGIDCFEVYYQSESHAQQPRLQQHTATKDATQNLPPRVQPGGIWEHSPKTPLEPEHYVPIQPVLRSQRRPTNHNREALRAYLDHQIADEAQWIERHKVKETSGRTVYMDGVFDLFHVGHLRAIEQCAALGDRVILGVTGDQDASSYKRQPIISQQNRVAVLRGLSCVDDIICPCPLVVTADFMAEHGIDLVVHGFADEADAELQFEFFEVPIRMGKFQRIDYYHGLSTSDIIGRVQRVGQEDLIEKETKWFGSRLRVETKGAQTLCIDTIRDCIEPHIAKSRQRRSGLMKQIEQTYNKVPANKLQGILRPVSCEEADFGYDTTTYCLREALIRAVRLAPNTDLSQLHQAPDAKYDMLEALTSNFADFQEIFNDFVLNVCAPRMKGVDELFCQSFPCLRVIHCGDFSIGPHCDMAYGHHPASVNFYIPLTPIFGTASLYMESSMEKEDWHPIIGNYGSVKMFAGGLCMHWTPENTTDFTRVSLDVRLIDGNAFRALRIPGDENLRDVPGYYYCCKKTKSGQWVREADELGHPDARMGFPWTVRDWTKFNKKRSQKGD